MKSYLTTLLLFVAVLTSNAQVSSSWSNSQDAINWLNENIAKVQLDKETYGQSIKFNSSEDDYTTLTITKVDAKGSTSTSTYEFYLGHIDASKTDFIVKGTAINISAKTTNGEEVIKLLKDGAFQVYKNELVIKCDDPQLAKDVVNAINFAIDSSTYKALSFENSSEAINWLSQEVKDFELSESKIIQSFEYFEDERKRMVLKTRESNAKSNVQWEYIFYANDFSDLLGNVDVSGEKFKIKFTTIDNEKMVKIFKDSEQQNFNKYFELSVKDPKLALNILEAFKVVFAKL